MRENTPTAADFPVGSIVQTDVWSIGGRCERVTGIVVDHWRGKLLTVATQSHGDLSVEPGKVVR